MRRTQALLTSGFMAFALLASAHAGEVENDRKSKSVTAKSFKKIQAASQKIDKIVAADWAKHKIKPNKPASDEVFLRRIYLDVIGRIPTYKEAITFLDSNDPKKRQKLIDKLLDSEGFVSHTFNYWADLLRLQSRMRYAPAQPYLDFVKNSIRENKPYDQFVRDLLTAEGYTWDNGAAGYYIRDTGMPLDNMSNTVQIFLGTQLVCAQCHNHPFDSWTQKQYYQLAAFTYQIETRDRRSPRAMELRRMYRNENMDREMYRAANRILRPLAYRVHEGDKELRLPKDYQYEDAKPREVIKPKAIFGEDVVVKPGDSRKEIYARWMTSAKNPRFTTNITNRLWARVMGVGVIDPVDDFQDGLTPSNPELLKQINKVMIDLKYDVKQYLRVLYNTKLYQREVCTEDRDPEVAWHFPGPILRRFSAEQIWDSFLTLSVPHLDQRKGPAPRYRRYTDGEFLVKKDMKEILSMAKVEANRRKAQVEYNEKTRELQKAARIAQKSGDREKFQELRDKINKIRNKIFGADTVRRNYRRQRNRRVDKDPRWAGFSTDLVRASELSSPARPGHFLRQFGQSDRETIENANKEATVPQILTLLNGPMFYQIANRRALLAKTLVDASTDEDRLEILFVSILSRRPTEEEKAATLPHLKGKGAKGISNVAWALLNTQEFMFVQ